MSVSLKAVFAMDLVGYLCSENLSPHTVFSEDIFDSTLVDSSLEQLSAPGAQEKVGGHSPRWILYQAVLSETLVGFSAAVLQHDQVLERLRAVYPPRGPRPKDKRIDSIKPFPKYPSTVDRKVTHSFSR